jgi:hypothetical protein
MGSGPKKWLLKRDWRLLKKYEGQVCKDFHAVLAVSEEDRKALEEAAGQSLNITVIPIAIDTDEITPVDFKAAGKPDHSYWYDVLASQYRWNHVVPTRSVAKSQGKPAGCGIRYHRSKSSSGNHFHG